MPERCISGLDYLMSLAMEQPEEAREHVWILMHARTADKSLICCRSGAEDDSHGADAMSSANWQICLSRADWALMPSIPFSGHGSDLIQTAEGLQISPRETHKWWEPGRSSFNLRR